MYKIKTDITGTKEIGVGYTNGATTVFIPFDPNNTDYQAYLKWLEEGNTPIPADE
jgi:hypothetical protein